MWILVFLVAMVWAAVIGVWFIRNRDAREGGLDPSIRRATEGSDVTQRTRSQKGIPMLLVALLLGIWLFCIPRVYDAGIRAIAPIERYGWRRVRTERIDIVEYTRRQVRFSESPLKWVNFDDLPRTEAWMAAGVPSIGVFMSIAAALLTAIVSKCMDLSARNERVRNNE